MLFDHSFCFWHHYGRHLPSELVTNDLGLSALLSIWFVCKSLLIVIMDNILYLTNANWALKSFWLQRYSFSEPQSASKRGCLFHQFRFSSVPVLQRKCFPFYKICRHDFGDCVRETPNAQVVSVTENPSRHAPMIWPH